MAELVEGGLAVATSASPACRRFTVELWGLWIGAAAFNEAMVKGVQALFETDRFDTGFLLLPLLGLAVVTVEWLVLRRALPGLLWVWWLFANAFSAAMTLACWVCLLTSGSFGDVVTPATAITTLITGTAAAAVLACPLWCASGRYPLAFFLCAIIAAFVVPLDSAIEQGPIRDMLSSGASDFSAVIQDWLSEREFFFLAFHPVALLPDSHTMFLVAQGLARVAVNVIGAAITGLGLWHLCRRAPRMPVDHTRRARRLLVALAAVTGLCVLFANRDLSHLDQPPKEEISRGAPILTFAFESSLRDVGGGWVSLRAVGWSGDSRYATAVYTNGTVRHFDVERQRVTRDIRLDPRASDVAFAADGRLLAVRLNGGVSSQDRGVALLDGGTLAEVARAPKQIDACTLASRMMFGSDGTLWVACYLSGSGAFAKPLAIKLKVPDLTVYDVLSVETTRGLQGWGTSINVERFFRGARDVMIAEEHSGEPTSSAQTRDPALTSDFLRVIDLAARKDLVPPIELSSGPINYTVQEAFLWQGGARLTVPLLAWVAAAHRGEISDAKLAMLPQYRVFDLDAGTVADIGGSPAPGRVTTIPRLIGTQRIAPFGFVVGTTRKKRSGTLLVFSEHTGAELQRIETVSQTIQSISPDGRWLVAQRFGQRDGCTLRFYRVSP